MGLTGFVLPLKRRPESLELDDFGVIWSEITSAINDWLEPRLTRDAEEELLEAAEELLDWPCELPDQGIEFLFAEHDVVSCSAGAHWYLRALRDNRSEVEKVLTQHGFEADFEALPGTDDGVLLAFPTDEGELAAVLVYPEHPDEIGVGDGGIAVEDLDDEIRSHVVALQTRAECECTLCSAVRRTGT